MTMENSRLEQPATPGHEYMKSQQDAGAHRRAIMQH